MRHAQQALVILDCAQRMSRISVLLLLLLVIMSRRRRIPAFIVICLSAFSFTIACTTSLRAQAIQIKLLDGKTGKPIVHACAGVWMKNDARKDAFIPTDKNGIARLHLALEANISYDPKLGCGGTSAMNPVLTYGDTLVAYSTGQNPSCAFPGSMPKERWKEIDFSTKEVLEHGVASANTCGNVAGSPRPGEVIVFVRPRNFSEKVRDWLNRESFPF